MPGSPFNGPTPVPYAAYPPDLSAVHQLGQQVQQAVNAQSAMINQVQQAATAQTQVTYDQMLILHQQQQAEAKKQMELNELLMQELTTQRSQQQVLMDQLVEQKKIAEAHEKGLNAAAESSRIQAAAFEEMKRRTSARWNVFTSAPPPVAPPTPATAAG